ncbi:MAG TPA: prepilin-type N-terminal cleavage/methylation domain-containing protein [Isosphaeraceae bacterium]
MRRPPQSPTRRRTGFTMIEILVVILIIAILMALLLPAINAAVNAANNARVAAEQQNLQTALADFKNKYGEYPPSRIILYNLVAGTTAAPYGASATAVTVPAGAVGTPEIDLGDLNQRTVRAMRKYFSRAAAYFPTTGTASVTITWSSGTNATNNGYVILSGDECLVFFLGGMPQAVSTTSGSGMAVTGFSRDPANPFAFASNATGTASRTTPLFEFAPQRLVDVDGDGFPSYIDPLSANNVVAEQHPYAYFSAYGNNGYDPNDCNYPQLDDAGNAIARSLYLNFAVHGGGRVTASAGPNPYTIGDADPATPTTNMNWVNPQTFQLISAGRDGIWGLGGPYDASSTSNKLPVGFAQDPSNASTVRRFERDNITNFSGGRLD